MIVDEMSMLGQKKLALLDERLREVKANKNPFGGLNIILVGDFAQLPPVGDNPMWKVAHEGEKNKHGYALFNQFNAFIELDQPKRQKDKKFIGFLNRLRDGNLIKSDWKMLNSRNPHLMKNKPENYDDFIRLFGSNAEVCSYNLKKLSDLDNPIAKIVAQHNHEKAMSAPPKKAWGLEPVLYVAVGALIMLRMNLCTANGLVNGTMGTVRDIIYEPGKGPDSLPRCLIVEVPDYTGPTLIANYPKCVPIVPFTANWVQGKQHYSRTQFPVKLSWAMTIHKSQGLTLENAVVDIGSKDIATGSIFVACSRLKTKEGLYFEPKSWDRIENLNSRKRLNNRIRVEDRLRWKEENNPFFPPNQ